MLNSNWFYIFPINLIKRNMIRRIILSIIANASAIYLLTYLLENISLSGGVKAFVITGIIFGFLNSLVKPLLKLISLPFVFLTAGLFIFVINAIMLWVLKFTLAILAFEGIELIIDGGVLTYLYASVVLAIVNTIIHWLIKK